MTGDAHTTWVMEIPVDPGDYPADAPVAAEFVGTSVTSINTNEQIGNLTIGRPLPHGAMNALAPAVLAQNRHVRWNELDSNGYYIVDLDSGRARVDYYFVVNPPGDVLTNPVENPAGLVMPAPGGAWVVARGSSRLLPAT